MDWHRWHDEYDRPGSALTRRLRAVQLQIRAVLDGARPGPLRVISLCAGQGRDLLGVLADHPRRDDVRARLVELDPRIAEVAQTRVRAAGLDRVEIGVHRFRGEPQPLAEGQHLFTFTRSGVLRQAGRQRDGQPSASDTATGPR